VLLCLRVQGNGSRRLQFEWLRGVDFVLGDVCKRKSWREGEERLLDREFQFQFQFRRQRREGVVLRKFSLTCMFVKTTPFWGPLSPKSPTQRRFGDYFLPKRITRRCFGDHFSPKSPTWRRFGDQISLQISHVGPAHSFFLFWFLILVSVG
jgi:hypothetical protein